MSMNNLTIDGEFRYVVQWFNEWSELQRDDFIPILVEYLATKATNATCEISPTASARRDVALDTNSHTNGIAEDVKNMLIINEKPLSLFQCRVRGKSVACKRKYMFTFTFIYLDKIISSMASEVAVGI